MVAIVIIAILVGLLLPAIRSAVGRARESQVVTEIKDLEGSLANFKGKFGMYPPSRLLLHENLQGWSNPPAALQAETLRSRALIRRVWPQFDFSIPRDFNKNGQVDVHVLNGSQCLVFFLGGVAAKGAMTGFSKNPSNPFALGGNREGPFFEFKAERLLFSASVSLTAPVFPAYADPLPNQTRPYLFVSSNGGRGYPGTGAADFGRSGMQSVYGRPGEDQNLNNQLDQGEDANNNSRLDVGQPFKQDTFQVISPGSDAEYGIGGTYSDELSNNLSGKRNPERDNITNFAEGTLAN